MQTNERRIWFPAKKYGWGWGPPCTWEGWLVSLAWVGLVIAGAAFLAGRKPLLFFAYMLAMATIMFLICLAKGETPRWRWGESEERPTRAMIERLAELDELHRRRLVSEDEYQARRREILRELAVNARSERATEAKRRESRN